MSLPFIDSSDGLRTPTETGARQWLRPFPDVSQKFIFRQKYYQLASDYEPGVLDSAHPEESGYYLVEESGLQPVQQGGVVEFSRTYSRIPEPRRMSIGYSWYRPAFNSENPPGVKVDINSASISNSRHMLTLDSVVGMAVDDFLLIRYNEYIYNVGTVTQTVRRTIQSIAGNVVGVKRILTGGAITGWLTAQEVSPSRSATTVSIPSEVEYDYFLPGVSPGISTPADIPRIEAFEAVSVDGGFTNALSETTDPTIAEYLAQIGNSTRIVVEGSTLRRWNGWNIIERAVRSGPAV